MISSFILNVLRKKDASIFEKLHELKKYYQYYRNLTNSLKDGTLYHRKEEQNSSLEELIQKTSELDFALVRNFLVEDVKKFLKGIKIKSTLNFSQPNDFIQVGFGAIFLTHPINSLWTTGKFTFYLPTKKGIDNNFKIEFFSIPPVKVEIGFEGNNEKKIEIGMLSTKSIELKIDSSKIKEDISEMYITTDNLWLSNKVIIQEKSVLLGVGIKSISNLTCNS